MKADKKFGGLGVHPAAAVFPMMDDEELASLAADIKENDLRFPIVTGDYEGKTVIIDGRNRFRACELAGVEPKFTELNGAEPKAFILSVNISRRHLTVGQRAMITAMIYPEAEKGGRGKNIESRKAAEKAGFGATRLKISRVVLRNSRMIAEAVLTGAKSLDAAYDEVMAIKSTAESDEARLVRIRGRDPELADMIVNGKLTLRGAEDELRERDRIDNEAIEHARQSAEELNNRTFGHVVNVRIGLEGCKEKLIDRKKLAKLIDALNELMEVTK